MRRIIGNINVMIASLRVLISRSLVINSFKRIRIIRVGISNSINSYLFNVIRCISSREQLYSNLKYPITITRLNSVINIFIYGG